MAVALGLLLTGIVLTWWAPGKAADPPVYLQVKTKTATTCGTLQSADGGQLVAAVKGSAQPAKIPWLP